MAKEPENTDVHYLLQSLSCAPTMAPHNTTTFRANPRMSTYQTPTLALVTNPHSMTQEIVSPVASDDAQMANHSYLTMLPSSVPFSVPPPLIHHKSPYARVPLPAMSATPVALNPRLRHEPVPCIEYSMLCSLSSATQTSPRPAHLQWLREPATFSNLASVTIRAPWQERAIVVFPRDATSGFITIWDILVAVHGALRAKARYIITNTYQHANGSAFYRRRQRDVTQSEEDAITSSIIMLVQGRTSWGGLSLSTMEAYVWLLHIR